MEAQIEKQLEKILPEDLARTFESAYHVFQGDHDRIDDLLKNGGVLIRKAAQRFTPTQMVLGIAAIAAVAVVLINRTTDDDHEGEAHDVSDKKDKK
jgi:recombination associated protein RdgC